MSKFIQPLATRMSSAPPPKLSDEELEAVHFNTVLAAFDQYRSYSVSSAVLVVLVVI